MMKPETLDHLVMAFLVAVPGVGFLIAVTAAALGADVKDTVWAAIGAWGVAGGVAKGGSGLASSMKKDGGG